MHDDIVRYIVSSPDRFIPFLFVVAEIKTEKSGLGTRLRYIIGGLIISTNLDGFSLANHGGFAKLMSLQKHGISI